VKLKTLTQYQEEVKRLVKKFNLNWSVYIRYIHLVEEIGELGEAITVHQGDRKAGSGESALADHTDLKEELGDALFGLIDIASQLGISMGEALEDAFRRYEGKLNSLNKKIE